MQWRYVIVVKGWLHDLMRLVGERAFFICVVEWLYEGTTIVTEGGEESRVCISVRVPVWFSIGVRK